MSTIDDIKRELDKTINEIIDKRNMMITPTINASCSWCSKNPREKDGLYCGDLCRESAQCWTERGKRSDMDREDYDQ